MKGIPLTPTRILLVSYQYPPCGGSGVQRPAALARYWARAGADVHVLTANHNHFPLHDKCLYDGTDEGVQIHRVGGCDPGGLAARLFPACAAQRDGWRFKLQQRAYWRLQPFAEKHAVLGSESWWVHAATRAARRIIREHRIDAIVTTSPPHAIQQVGARIQQKMGIPWIADLRDPIIDNFGYIPRSQSAHDRWVQLEIQTVTQAAHVVVTCDDYGAHLRAKYQLAHPAITCITNGYESEALQRGTNGTAKREMFTLSHVGAFYHSQSPQALLAAFRALREEDSDFRRCFRLRLVGSIARHLEDLFEQADDEFVECRGYVDHDAAKQAMHDSNALFLMTPDHAYGRFCYPGKTFEYLATDRPVLGLVHRDSSLMTLLRTAGGVDVACHQDIEGIQRVLRTLFQNWQRGSCNVSRDAGFVRQFDRDPLARRYLELIDDVRQALSDDDSSATMFHSPNNTGQAHHPMGASESRLVGASQSLDGFGISASCENPSSAQRASVETDSVLEVGT